MRLFIPLALIVLTLEFVGCKNEGGSSSVTGDVKLMIHQMVGAYSSNRWWHC